MIDLGLFNYIKNGLAQGKSLDQIAQELAAAGWAADTVRQTMDAVMRDEQPGKVKPVKKSPWTAIGSYAVILILIGAFLWVATNFQKLPEIASIFVAPSLAQVTGTSETLTPYTDSDIGVTINVPVDWQLAKNQGTADNSAPGFTVSKTFGVNTVATIQVNQQIDTLLLVGVVLARRSAITANPSVQMIQDKDVTAGNQDAHIFEYTTTTANGKQHDLEGYVLENGYLYSLLAQGPDADWSQIPAIDMFDSITFTK